MSLIWTLDSKGISGTVPVIEDSTLYLAAGRIDWVCIKAQDLMVLFNSFEKSEWLIQSLVIYLSLDGKQRRWKVHQGPWGGGGVGVASDGRSVTPRVNRVFTGYECHTDTRWL